MPTPFPTSRRLPLVSLCALLSLLCLSLACSPADPLTEVRARQGRGDMAGTIEPLRALLAERPDDPEVNYLYGRALNSTGQTSLAEWSLRNASRDPEWLIPAGMQLALGAIRSQNYETAIEVTEDLLEAEPENLDVMLLRAQAFARSRRFPEEAIAEADRILEVDPTNTDAMEPKLMALLLLERTEEAREELDRLGKLIEESDDISEWTQGWYCATTAIFADESDEEERAIELWAECTERFPSHSNVVMHALRFYDGRQEYDKSLGVLEGAVEGEPKSLDYRKRLGLRLRYAGRNEEAEQLMVEGTEVADPVYAPAAWIDLAKLYQDSGRHEESVAAMEKAVELSRSVAGEPAAEFLFAYADALVLQKKHDEALAVADEMTVQAHAELIRARVAQDRGRHAKALEHFDEAFRLWPDNPWARYFAAVSAEATGQFDRAIEAYRYSIRIDAEATDARYRLALLLSDQGRLAEALPMLRMRVNDAPLGFDGELLSIELFAAAGQSEQVAQLLQRFHEYGGVAAVGAAIARVADGIHQRGGAGSAVKALRTYHADGLEVQSAERPSALRKLVEYSHEAGDLGDLDVVVRAHAKRHPQVPAIQEIAALHLELGDAAPDEVRAAYERVLALDPENARGNAGLARVAGASGDAAEALARFEKAAAASPGEPAYALGAAEQLVALDRTDEAEARLRAILVAHPHASEAAAGLVEIHLARGTVTAETAALAERAVAFRGGAPALDLLARVFRERGEPERAANVEARAAGLRASAAPPS